MLAVEPIFRDERKNIYIVINQGKKFHTWLRRCEWREERILFRKISTWTKNFEGFIIFVSGSKVNARAPTPFLNKYHRHVELSQNDNCESSWGSLWTIKLKVCSFHSPHFLIYLSRWVKKCVFIVYNVIFCIIYNVCIKICAHCVIFAYLHIV